MPLSHSLDHSSRENILVFCIWSVEFNAANINNRPSKSQPNLNRNPIRIFRYLIVYFSPRRRRRNHSAFVYIQLYCVELCCVVLCVFFIWRCFIYLFRFRFVFGATGRARAFWLTNEQNQVSAHKPHFPNEEFLLITRNLNIWNKTVKCIKHLLLRNNHHCNWFTQQVCFCSRLFFVFVEKLL